jgi:apolipoprotein N-acyltransferase
MHLAHAVFRAVELRTWVVRAANTGISALVDPRGRVSERLGLERRGSLHGEVRESRATTLYARAGDAPALALLAAAGGAALLARPRTRAR